MTNSVSENSMEQVKRYEAQVAEAEVAMKVARANIEQMMPARRELEEQARAEFGVEAADLAAYIATLEAALTEAIAAFAERVEAAQNA